MAEVKSNEPARSEVAEFMDRYGDTKTGEIREKGDAGMRTLAADVVDYDREENAYAEANNHAKGALSGAEWWQHS